MDFKERVRDSIVAYSVLYKEIFLDYEYLLYSPDFVHNPYYIVSANEDNYCHLTGVHALLSAQAFYARCYDGTISIDDFDFTKGEKSKKSIKGLVREKILALPNIATLFSQSLYAEENFSKGKVHCFFATADDTVTIGFVNTSPSVPKTLLRRNQLDSTKRVNVTLVLRRSKGVEAFDTVLQGDAVSFCTLFPRVLVNYWKPNPKTLPDPGVACRMTP